LRARLKRLWNMVQLVLLEQSRREGRSLNAPECAVITAFPNAEIRTLQLTRFVQRRLAAGFRCLA
jgi:hypothetical protein